MLLSTIRVVTKETETCTNTYTVSTMAVITITRHHHHHYQPISISGGNGRSQVHVRGRRRKRHVHREVVIYSYVEKMKWHKQRPSLIRQVTASPRVCNIVTSVFISGIVAANSISVPGFAVAYDGNSDLELDMKATRDLLYGQKTDDHQTQDANKRSFPSSFLRDVFQREATNIDPIESFTVYGTTSKKFFIEVSEYMFGRNTQICECNN